MNLDALLAPIPSRGNTPCKLARTIADLPEPYKTALQNLVDTPWAEGGLSDSGLRKRLLEAGIDIGATNIHYHRRGTCSCRKSVTA
jgi:hypothetical protein